MWFGADLYPHSALHAAMITGRLADSFASPVEETKSSAPGGPGDDLLGGESYLSLTCFGPTVSKHFDVNHSVIRPAEWTSTF